MHEPRLKPAMGVGYAVAPVGADHQMNMHDTAYLRPAGMRRVNSALAEPLPPLARAELDENKSVVFYHELNWSHFLDCALICQFYCYDYAQMAEAMSGVTGVEYGIHDILAIGERAQTLSRLLNLREGSGAEEDRLPRRVMTAFEAGPLEGSGRASRRGSAWKRWGSPGCWPDRATAGRDDREGRPYVSRMSRKR